MLDLNKFKRNVKSWMDQNPDGSVEDLTDFCETLISSHQYQSYSWIIDETIQWFMHVQAIRKKQNILVEPLSEA